jgi:hypothetical protein
MAKRKTPPVLTAAIGVMAPDVVHAVASPLALKPHRKRVRVQLALTTEDHKFLSELAAAHGISLGSLISRQSSLTCRTIRTGRDPLTGEPIEWRAATHMDWDMSNMCAKAIHKLRTTPASANDTIICLRRAAKALENLSHCFEGYSMSRKDIRKTNRGARDSQALVDSKISETESRLSDDS